MRKLQHKLRRQRKIYQDTGTRKAENSYQKNILDTSMPYRRFRRRSFRGRRMYNPIQSYKQITIDGPASRAAATNIVHTIALGVDNYAGPSAANNEVPTGAKISSIDVQIAAMNLVSQVTNMVMTVQVQRSGQGVDTPNAQGGSATRNQVIFTRNVFLGKDQNNNFHFRVRLPRIYQRMRENSAITIVTRADTVWTSLTQAIYKFYR